MSANDEVAVVELKIPGRAEFVGVIRLAVLGVASRMRFSYDEVEDIRLAVGEACATAIERANGIGRTPEVLVRCRIEPGKLVIEVSDPSAVGENEASSPPATSGNVEEPSLGGILIRILMDEVQSTIEEGRRVLRMVKFVTTPAEAGS